MLTAVIVEPRKHAALEFVIRNVVAKVNCPICVYHGSSNKEFVLEILKHLPANKITLHDMKVSNLTRDQYSRLLVSKRFWESLEGRSVLVFQTDSMFLKSPRDIKRYLRYDYIGAPWTHSKHRLKVGNGGFSLRNRRSMMWLIDKYWKSPGLVQLKWHKKAEDVFFALMVNRFKWRFRVPSAHTASTFSVESKFTLGSLAIHKAWKHLSKKRMSVLISKTPELATLVSLNKKG